MKKYLYLSITSGILLWLGWPPTRFTTPLLFIGFVPLLSVTEQLAPTQNTNKKNGIYIFTFIGLSFLLWNIGSIYWVYYAIRVGTGNIGGLFVSLIPWGLGTLLMTVSFWGYFQLKKNLNKWLAYIGLLCLWTSYEYLHQTWDLAFPWMTLGNGLAEWPQLIQWYSYTGVYGGTIWILICNILLFECYTNIRKHNVKQHKFIIISSILCFLIPISISLTMYYSYEETENPCHVVVIQPNIDPYQKYNGLSVSEQEKRLIKLSDSLGISNTEFFIWPETAIAEYVDEENIRQYPIYQQLKQFISHYKNGNILSGIESYKTYGFAKTPSADFIAQHNRYIDNFNAATLIDNSDKIQFYHKSILVPGVEKFPFKNNLTLFKPLFAKLGGATGSYGSQLEPSVFYSQGGIGVAPIICYESIWGNYVAKYMQKEAQFIAIITNDAWWGNTSGKDQHLAYARLRAIETRRWVARSANTGISAFINQRGDVVQKTNWWKIEGLRQTINLNTEKTFYVQHGDWLIMPLICTEICLIICSFAIGIKRKKLSCVISKK